MIALRNKVGEGGLSWFVTVVCYMGDGGSKCGKDGFKCTIQMHVFRLKNAMHLKLCGVKITSVKVWWLFRGDR